MKRLLVLFFTVTLNASAQVGIDTLRLQPTAVAGDFLFPLVRTGSNSVDAAINNDLKNRFTGNQASIPADSALVYYTRVQLFSLGFEVTYNRNELLSLNVRAESCGAHCNAWTTYFNYSTVTGAFLNLGAIADTSGLFKEMVFQDKDRQFEMEKRGLRDKLTEKGDQDTASYHYLLEHYTHCYESFSLGSFALHSRHLEIIHPCHPPNIIKSLLPEIVLRYDYASIRNFLRVKGLLNE